MKQRKLTFEQSEQLNDLDRNRTDGGVGCIFDGTNYLCRDVLGVEGYGEYQELMLEATPYIPPMTPYEFKLRLTTEERIGIREAAKTNPIIYDFMDMLNSASNVFLDDPITMAGIGYLKTQGILTVERETAILNPD